MSLEIIGKVVQLGQRMTGEGRNGTWVKQELIVETEGQYPKKVCLICWGERADEASAFIIGERVKANINIESREYNGKWYTDVKPWKLERVGVSTEAASDQIPPATDDFTPETGMDDDLPF